MNLIQTSILSSISTAIKIAAGLVSNKVVALYVGPSGIALLGQFQNFANIIITLANGGTNNGVVKFVAEYHGDERKCAEVITTSLYISLASSALIALVLVVFRQELSMLLLKSGEYSFAFSVLGCSAFVFSFNTLVSCALNGFNQIRTFIKLNIMASLAGLAFIVPLSIFLGLYGALISYALSQVLVFFLTAFFVSRMEPFKRMHFLRFFNAGIAKGLGKFSIMLLTTAFTVPVSHIIVRDYIIKNISVDAAGFWQGVWVVSSGYLTVVTTSLGVYYLPKLSKTHDPGDLRKEIAKVYKFALPVVAAFATAIYLGRDFIIHLLYTGKFAPMRDLFLFQLTGDFIKISGWIFGYLTIAKTMTKVFIFSELFFTSSFVLLSVFFLNAAGLVGITYAYSLNYLLYLAFMLWVFRGLIFQKRVEP